jgi:transcriptional regulator with XRE-family HTH domain
MSDVRKFFDGLEREARTFPERELNEDFVNLAVNLARIRREQDLTQAELASLVGTSQPRVAEIERAQGNPTLRTLANLAHALGVTIAKLVAEPQEDVPSLHAELAHNRSDALR